MGADITRFLAETLTTRTAALGFHTPKAFITRIYLDHSSINPPSHGRHDPRDGQKTRK